MARKLCARCALRANIFFSHDSLYMCPNRISHCSNAIHFLSYQNWMFKLVGTEHFTFHTHGQDHLGCITIEPSGFQYSYSLELDGKPLEKLMENSKRVTKTWRFPLDGVNHIVVLGEEATALSRALSLSLSHTLSLTYLLYHSQLYTLTYFLDKILEFSSSRPRIYGNFCRRRGCRLRGELPVFSLSLYICICIFFSPYPSRIQDFSFIFIPLSR